MEWKMKPILYRILLETVQKFSKLLQSGVIDINSDPQKIMDSKEEANFVPYFIGDSKEIVFL